MLKGQKVHLRELRRADIKYFLEWFNDMEVTQYLAMYLPMTEMSEEKFIEETGNDRTKAFFVIEAVEGDGFRPIGSTGLVNINAKDHNATFGISIGDKTCWSKGCGTEAAELLVRYGFEQLNLHRINSSAFAFNERSIRMHKRVGFIEEGRQREMIFKNGKYHDLVLFGMLRDERSKLE